MHRKGKLGMPLLALWLALAPVNGQSPDEVQRIVHEILELDGTAETVRNMRALFENDLEFQEEFFHYTPEQVEAHREWIAIVFEDSYFERDLIHGFAEGFNPDAAKLVLERLRSPLFRKISQIEAEANRPDRPTKLNTFLNSDEGRRLMETRADMLKKFAQVDGCLENHLDTLSAQELARMSVENSLLPAAERMSEEEQRAIIERMREDMRERVFAGCWVPLVYTYRNVSDEELEEYSAFFDTEAGTWYSESSANGIRQAWLSAGIRLGRRGFVWPHEKDGSDQRP